MNKVILIGNIVKDVKTFTTNNGVIVYKNTIAVKRNYQSQNGEKETDFINFAAFGKLATIIDGYTKKGDKIYLEGIWSVNSYDNYEGKKIYNNELIVEKIELIERKKEKVEENKNYVSEQKENKYNDFYSDEGFPF